jgi:subtilisin family serine protease
MGARVINLSAALLRPSSKSEQRIQEALNYAAHRGTLIVAAAGNEGTVGSSIITRHPWVIPVAACDLGGRLLNGSTLGNSIGRRGLTAPGQSVVSLGTNGGARMFSGTSAAAPFVTGAIALLLSEFLDADPAAVKLAVSNAGLGKRGSIGPPLLNAWMAFQILASSRKVRSAT